jgi:hypothetical protein
MVPVALMPFLYKNSCFMISCPSGARYQPGTKVSWVLCSLMKETLLGTMVSWFPGALMSYTRDIGFVVSCPFGAKYQQGTRVLWFSVL